MTAEQFAYWMQGFAELSENPPSAEQWKSIRKHLATVFVKVTPEVDFSKLRVGEPPKQADIPCDWLREARLQRPVDGIEQQSGDRLRSECAADIRTGYAKFEPLANGADTI